jgi:hypothetical protein
MPAGRHHRRERGYRAEEGLARARQAQAILPQLRYRSAALELGVLMDLAESYRIAGRYGPAIAAFEQAYARTIELGRENTENAGTLYNNWALVLSDTGQTLQAEALFRRAMQISSADGTEKNVSPMVLSNLATILIELGRIDEAQRYADQAYERARAEGDEVIARFALGARGRVFRARGQYRQGMQTEGGSSGFPPRLSARMRLLQDLISVRAGTARRGGDKGARDRRNGQKPSRSPRRQGQPDVLPRSTPRRDRACARPARRRPMPSDRSRVNSTSRPRMGTRPFWALRIWPRVAPCSPPARRRTPRKRSRPRSSISGPRLVRTTRRPASPSGC